MILIEIVFRDEAGKVKPFDEDAGRVLMKYVAFRA